MSTDENLDDQLAKSPIKPTIVDDALPPVEAPNAGFILQLFFIPMIIVSIIVMVWLMFSWLAHMGTNPSDLVQKLEKGDDAAWQRAGILADMLQNPQKEHLKVDKNLALKLSDVLKREMQKGGTKRTEVTDNQINLRIYLCRALGEFHLPDVLPALLEAAATERDGSEIELPNEKGERKLTELDVRRTALEAIAVLATNIDRAALKSNDELIEVLIEASREQGDQARDEYLRRELRSTAAFVLGILGGDKALERLDILLGDSYPNTRFNAASALARHGDVRAIPELIDMLDPENDDVVAGEKHKTGKEYKRALVMTTAVQASKVLAENNQTDELTKLEDVLAKLADADIPIKVRGEIRKVLRVFQERKSKLQMSKSSPAT